MGHDVQGMSGDHAPAPQNHLRPVFTEPSRALRLILEVDLSPEDRPTSLEAAAILTDALGSAALGDIAGQIRHVTYENGDRRPEGTLAMPFPADSRPPRRSSESDEMWARHFGLSDREVEVLNLVAQGHTNGQIARRLFLTPETVSTHLVRSYAKLHANNRAHAVSIFQGIIPQPPPKSKLPKKSRGREEEPEIIELDK